MNGIGSNILLFLIVFYTIAIWIIYHKIFDVYYFNLSNGLLREFIVSLIGGIILAGITVTYWYVAAIILLIVGFAFAQKASDPSGRKACIVVFIILAIIISIIGISLNKKNSNNETNKDSNTYSTQVDTTN